MAGLTKKKYDINFYAKVVEKFIQTGECAANAYGETEDPLYLYLLSIMNNPSIRLQVLEDEVRARIFYDITTQFVWQFLEQERFQMQRAQSELGEMESALNWIKEKRDGWQALLRKIKDDYKESAFDEPFYEHLFGDKEQQHDPSVWEKMLSDWEDSFQQKQQEQKEKNLNARKDFLEKKLTTSLSKIPEYLEEHQVEQEEFFQAWSMMNGLWNTIDFESIRKIVKLQKEYPELLKVANRMGRIADDEGSKQVYVTEGSIYKLSHSQKSDILGVTTGNDLNALLPSELLYYSDSELQDVFMLKYFTQKLQTFRYKSEIMQPSRRLEAKPAVLKGPMIVCLDTSGSMTGKPERMANSLLIKLIEIAELQDRECFLISFSVSTRTIDVRRERQKLMEFFSHPFTGDTDATQMLKDTFRMLDQNRYMNADVLLISDFRIPECKPELIKQMQANREKGTFFYGLQIGIAPNEWMEYFDHMYKVEYQVSRRN